MAKILAEELTALGHRVTVVTMERDVDNTQFEFKIVRRPSPLGLVRLARLANVVLQMNLSLKGLWLFLFVRRPLIVSHQGPYRRRSGHMGLRDRLKYRAARLVTNISCSSGIRGDLPANTIVVWNAYDDKVFRHWSVDRNKDLVFVGRLVSDKGLDLLLNSLVVLREKRVKPSLTIVGLGPEEYSLRRFCHEMQMQDQVTFAGQRTGSELAALINQHRIMVVPSRSEGFGIVALEGIACGCIVVGSDTGGLPEAIGNCGIIFRSGDVVDLSKVLMQVLADKAVEERILAAREHHLARFTRREVARQYLEVIENTLAHSGSR